jgi:hypothetical protein
MARDSEKVPFPEPDAAFAGGHVNHLTTISTMANRKTSSEILLIPCMILRFSLVGSPGPGLRNVMYPTIFFQTSMLDQLSHRNYVFPEEKSGNFTQKYAHVSRQ